MLLLFLPKKIVFHLGVAHNDTFFVQIGPKKIFKRFYQLFFRTNGLQHKLLILIESLNIFHWKSAKKKVNWVWSLGQNLGKLGPMFGKNQRNWYFAGFFSYFT